MSPLLEMIVRLLVAGAIGAVIGYQRERAKRPAGLRTHLLVCVGAAIITITSIYGFGGLPGADPSRVAAGIVIGIGFLGGGVIIRRTEGGTVGGLTTAATIWAVAGLGLAVGAGLYIPAVIAAVLILIALILPHPIQ